MKVIASLIVSCFLIGCSLHAKIFSLDNASSSGQSTVPQIVGIFANSIDETPDEFLVGDDFPILKIDSGDTGHEYNFKIYSSISSSNSLCEGVYKLTSNIAEFSNCNLADGNYFVEACKADSANTSCLEKYSFTKNTIKLNFVNYKLLPGESVIVSPTGGFPTYTFENSGSGNFDLINFIFTAPIDSVTNNTTLKFKDSKNQSVNIAMNWKKYSNVGDFQSNTFVSGNFSNADQIEVGADIFLVGSGVNVTGPAYIVLLKSSDNGVTWSEVLRFQGVPGANNSVSAIKYYNNSFYISGIGTGITTSSFIAKIAYPSLLIDSIKTFSEEVEFNIRQIMFADDGKLIIGGNYISTATSNYVIFVKRCDVLNWSCNNVYSYESDGGINKIFKIVKDGLGKIYFTSREYDNGFSSSNNVLRRSNDNGITWNVLDSQFAPGNAYSLAVSADGQNILYGGGSTSNFVFESTNGGSSWASSSISCGWSVKSIIFDNSNNALASCYNFSGGFFTWQIKRKNFGSTTWNSTFSLGGIIYQGADLFLLSSGRTLAFSGLNNYIKNSDNFGGSWNANISYPSANTTLANYTIREVIQYNANTFFAVGMQDEAFFDNKAIVMKSTDSGVTWVTDQRVASISSFKSIAKSAVSNYIFAGGANGVAPTNWLVYKYDDGVGTWSSSESFIPPSSSSSSVEKMVSTGGGRIYALGSYMNSYSRGYVRHTDNNGTAWSPSLEYVYAAGYGTVLLSAVPTTGNSLNIVGYGTDSSSIKHWLVGSFDGTSWTTMDDDTFGGYNSTARNIKIAANGDIYVVGFYTKNSLDHWVVKRKKTAGSWEILDDYSEANANIAPSNLTIDEVNNVVHVIGSLNNFDGTKYSIIRSYKDGKWFTSNKLSESKNSNGTSIINCLNNQMCSLVNYFTSGGYYKTFFKVLSE